MTAASSLAPLTDPLDPRAAAPARLAVRRLALTDFRCYAGLRLELDPRPVVLTGPNGAGKTNLIEAVSFLVPGRGLRRARLSDVVRRDTDATPRVWAVAATLATQAGPVEIGTGLDPAALAAPIAPTALAATLAPVTFSAAAESGEDGAGRRLVRIDGSASRGQAALGAVASAVWLTPEMDRLFVEGRSARRRFVDRLVYGFDRAHAGRVAAYEQAMR
ncbi:MAG: hypothetical protein FJX67_14830, partial [Alphaproteobacteria bacterium]|nr:hypothetical protein [Alphaproteobacteria bacterium]